MARKEEIIALEIKVIPGASCDKVLALSDTSYKVYMKAKALEGKANEALMKLLGNHFGVSKSRIKIIRGEHSRNKLVEIL